MNSLNESIKSKIENKKKGRAQSQPSRMTAIELRRLQDNINFKVHTKV